MNRGSRIVIGAALLASFAVTTPARGDFIIELRDGRRLRAPFMRIEGAVIHASQPAGELTIDKATVVSVQEVSDGAWEEPPPAPSDAPPPPSPAPSVPSMDFHERDRVMARQIILGHRELLFARLRGDAPASIVGREQELEHLTEQRRSLNEHAPTWEKSGAPRARP